MRRELTRRHQPGVHRFATVCLLIIPAQSTPAARVQQRFDTSAIPHAEVLDIPTNLDNHSGAFVARRSDSKRGHRRGLQIPFHQVEIGGADPGGIQAEKDFIGAWILSVS